jgi:hypothetical protein
MKSLTLLTLISILFVGCEDDEQRIADAPKIDCIKWQLMFVSAYKNKTRFVYRYVNWKDGGIINDTTIYIKNLK